MMCVINTHHFFALGLRSDDRDAPMMQDAVVKTLVPDQWD